MEIGFKIMGFLSPHAAAIMKWVAWSFEALGEGRHPTHDPDGKPLKKESPFYEARGQPLTNGGYRAVIWSIQGDQEFFSNTLQLPHWRNPSPCWLCDAKLSTNKPGKDANRYSDLYLIESRASVVGISMAAALHIMCTAVARRGAIVAVVAPTTTPNQAIM